ncbi:hypothetical protein L1887_32036 [Cichorium endivia]|nr:hypothetical protein L1887_32036 [Cichorium endivia]
MMMVVNWFSHFAVVLSLVMTAHLSYATGDGFELMNQLNRLNKSSVKSIKSLDGDIIDCVPISNQSAFDHPSSKTTKFSMQVSSEKHETVTQFWHLNGNCPKGTIPVRRKKKEDILRASFINKYGKKTSQSIIAYPRLSYKFSVFEANRLQN